MVRTSNFPSTMDFVFLFVLASHTKWSFSRVLEFCMLNFETMHSNLNAACVLQRYKFVRLPALKDASQFQRAL